MADGGEMLVPGCAAIGMLAFHPALTAALSALLTAAKLVLLAKFLFSLLKSSASVL